MALNISLPEQVAQLPESVARRHSQRLRDFASIFLLAELQSADLPSPGELFAVLEDIYTAYECALILPPPAEDPAPRLRAAGALR